MTVENATAKVAGQESTVTAAAAAMRAFPKKESCAAAGASASAATVSAWYREHRGICVRSAPHVEMPVPLQGERERENML